jgi:hypothetical protein
VPVLPPPAPALWPLLAGVWDAGRGRRRRRLPLDIPLSVLTLARRAAADMVRRRRRRRRLSRMWSVKLKAPVAAVKVWLRCHQGTHPRIATDSQGMSQWCSYAVSSLDSEVPMPSMCLRFIRA